MKISQIIQPMIKLISVPFSESAELNLNLKNLKRKADDKVTKIGQMNGLGAARDATTGGRTAAWLLLPQARSSWVAAGGRGDHEAGRCPRQANEKRRQSDADFNQSQGFDIETQKFKIKINSKRIQLES